MSFVPWNRYNPPSIVVFKPLGFNVFIIYVLATPSDVFKLPVFTSLVCPNLSLTYTEILYDVPAVKPLHVGVLLLLSK